MTPYTVSPLAQVDVDEIWSYVARDNVSAADRLIDTFHEKFLLLSAQPLIGQSRDELAANLRSFVAGKYVIYYQRTEERIRIVRVLHGSRDVGSLF